jgi:hypothetical protein
MDVDRGSEAKDGNSRYVPKKDQIRDTVIANEVIVLNLNDRIIDLTRLIASNNGTLTHSKTDNGLQSYWNKTR